MNCIKTKFALEIKENGPLSFLDIKISHRNKKSMPSVYHNHAFGDVFTVFKVLYHKLYTICISVCLLKRYFI